MVASGNLDIYLYQRLRAPRNPLGICKASYDLGFEIQNRCICSILLVKKKKSLMPKEFKEKRMRLHLSMGRVSKFWVTINVPLSLRNVHFSHMQTLPLTRHRIFRPITELVSSPVSGHLNQVWVQAQMIGSMSTIPLKYNSSQSSDL